MTSESPEPHRGNWKHGKNSANSHEYRKWASMKSRCYNPKVARYVNYGGRGITVCDRWRESFLTFYADMGPCPIGYTIERIDNEGHYTPENCRWASRTEQANNTRHNHRLTMAGRTMTIRQWERHLGLTHGIIKNRLKDGWSHEEALTTVPRKVNRKFALTFGEKTHSIPQWSKLTGMSRFVLWARYKAGWPVDRILTEPVARNGPKRRL